MDFQISDFTASRSAKAENFNGPEQAVSKDKDELGFNSEDTLASGNFSGIFLRTILLEFSGFTDEIQLPSKNPEQCTSIDNQLKQIEHQIHQNRDTNVN